MSAYVCVVAASGSRSLIFPRMSLRVSLTHLYVRPFKIEKSQRRPRRLTALTVGFLSFGQHVNEMPGMSDLGFSEPLHV
jgi:hypothetical protein